MFRNAIASTSRLPLRPFCTCSPRLAGIPKGRNRNPNTTSTFLRQAKPLNPNYPKTELHLALKDTTAITARPVLINETSCREIVKAWGVDKMEDVTIIEAYSGPGGLTRALLELPNVKRVISIEQAWRYLPMLQAVTAKYPDRHSIIEGDPFSWESYDQLTDGNLLDDVPKTPWNTLSTNLFLIAQLPNQRHGEQLFVQWANCMATRMWLFQERRFALGLVGAKPYFAKLTAPVSTPLHHKLAVLMAATADIEEMTLPGGLTPPGVHFHHPQGDPANFSVMKVTPLAKAKVGDYEGLEHITRHMFVTKGYAWQKAIRALAPGAENLIPKILADPLFSNDPQKTVNDLTMDEWAIISREFMAWPFKPKVLFDDGGHSEFAQ